MGIDVYDYTLLHKKGLLKIPERKTNNGITFNKEGDIDFTKMNVSPEENVVMPQIVPDFTSSSTPQAAPTENAFSFLDSFAQNASPSPPVMPSPISDLSMSSSSMGNGDMTHVKQRLDAIDYSLNRLLDRLQSIEEKLARNP